MQGKIVAMLALLLVSSTFGLAMAQSYNQVTTFTGGFTAGSTSATTDTFQIQSNSFRIKWSYSLDRDDPSVSGLGFFVYPAGASDYVADSGMHTGMSQVTGTVYVNQGNGQYYIKVLGANTAYELIVEQADVNPTQTSQQPLPTTPELPAIALIVVMIAAAVSVIAVKRVKAQ